MSGARGGQKPSYLDKECSNTVKSEYQKSHVDPKNPPFDGQRNVLFPPPKKQAKDNMHTEKQLRTQLMEAKEELKETKIQLNDHKKRISNLQAIVKQMANRLQKMERWRETNFKQPINKDYENIISPLNNNSATQNIQNLSKVVRKEQGLFEISYVEVKNKKKVENLQINLEGSGWVKITQPVSIEGVLQISQFVQVDKERKGLSLKNNSRWENCQQDIGIYNFNNYASKSMVQKKQIEKNIAEYAEEEGLSIKNFDRSTGNIIFHKKSAPKQKIIFT